MCFVKILCETTLDLSCSLNHLCDMLLNVIVEGVKYGKVNTSIKQST